MKHNQNGFSPVIMIMGLLVVGVIGFGGWTVYQNNKESDLDRKPTTKAAAVTKDKEVIKEVKVTTPDGWTQYLHTESGISFYHPGQWAKDDIKIDMYEVEEAISSGYGTPDSVVYDSTAKTWDMYLNYGHAEQIKIAPPDVTGDYALKTVTLTKSEHPAAYRLLGHASVATHDIYMIGADKAVRIRLPSINSFDDQEWEKKLAEQSQALPEIIKSIAVR